MAPMQKVFVSNASIATFHLKTSTLPILRQRLMRGQRIPTSITLVPNTTRGECERRFWIKYRIKYACIVMILYWASRAVRRRGLRIRRYLPSPTPRRTGVSNVTKMSDISVKKNYFLSRKGRKEPWKLRKEV